MDFDDDFISQEDLLDGINFPVLEASLDEGQTRSNASDNDVNSLIIDRGHFSDYKVQAALKTCIHGVLDSDTRTPASLIIVDYSLFNIKEQGRYSSATISYTFAPTPPPSNPTLPTHLPPEINILHTPSVVAFAPFATPARWAPSTAQKDAKHTFEASVNPSTPAGQSGKIGYAHESSSSRDQKYFTQGLASLHHLPPGPGRHIAHNVWWNLQHDFSQSSGVPPKIRTAVLVTRPVEAAGQEFTIKVKIAVRGGWGYKLEQLKDRFLRRNVDDRKFRFDPATKIVGERLDGLEENKEGEFELGGLVEGGKLKGLSFVWGLEPLGDS